MTHVAAFLFWPAVRRPAQEVDHATPTLWLLPVPTILEAAPNRPQAVVASPKAVNRPRRTPVAHAPVRPTMVIDPVAAPNAAPALSADTSVAPNPTPLHDKLIADFKRAAAEIDHELHRTSRNMAERTPTLKGTAIARAISAAYIDRTPAKQEEIVLSDGTRVTRIGNTCYMKDNGGRTRGLDHIARGLPTMARECWQAGLPMR